VQFEFVINDTGMPGDLKITIRSELGPYGPSTEDNVTIPISTVPQRPDDIRWYPLQRREFDYDIIEGDLG
jgi:hypothetical protein